MLHSNPGKPDKLTKKTVEIYNNAQKRTAVDSVENVVTNRSMRRSNNFNPSHRLSERSDVEIEFSRVSSRLNESLPKDEKSFFSLKERLEIRRDRESNIDTDDPHYTTFLNYGVRRDCNEWSLPRSF